MLLFNERDNKVYTDWTAFGSDIDLDVLQGLPEKVTRIHRVEYVGDGVYESPTTKKRYFTKTKPAMG